MPKVPYITPEEKLIIEDGINSGRQAVDILKDVYSKTKKPEIRKAIENDLKRGTHPVELVDKIRATPVKTEGITEALSYRIKRVPQIGVSQLHEFERSLKEARHAPLYEPWKHLLAVLEGIDVVASPITAPIRAFVGEPIGEKLTGKLPKWAVGLAVEAPEMIAIPAAAKVAGAALRGSKLLKAYKAAEETLEPSYGLHKAVAAIPLEEEAWTGVIKKVGAAKELPVGTQKMWRSEFTKDVRKLLSDLKTSLVKGDIDKALKKSGTLVDELQKIISRNPELADKIPVFTKKEMEGLIQTIIAAPKWEKESLANSLIDVIKGKTPKKEFTRVLGISKIPASYEKHLSAVKAPLTGEAWDRIVLKIQILKELNPAQRKLWREEYGKKMEAYVREFDIAMMRGDLDEAVRAAKALEGDLQALLARHPEFAEKIPIFTKEEIEGLLKAIHSAPKTFWQKHELANALIDVMVRHRVPMEHHLKALQEILGFDVTLLTKGGYLTDLIAFPRAIMASTDLSGIFRQGIMAVGRPQFWKNIPTYVKSFKEKNYETVMESIITDPYFGKAKKAGLELSNILTGSEELFVSKLRPWIIGRVIEASDRGYQGFLNKLRYDLFKDMGTKLEALGYTIEENADIFQKLATYVNALTGRGPLKGKIGSAIAQADILFAPRLVSSRLYFLDPTRYLKLPKELRREYLRDVFSFLGFGTGILTLASLNGAKIETNPTSADFMKAKFGNTRIDPWGGFLPYVVLVNRLFKGGMVSTTTGKYIELGEGIGKIGYPNLLTRGFEMKLAPVPAFLLRWFRGSDFIGQPFDILKETIQMLTPLVFQDVFDAIDTEPTSLWYAIPASALGFGVQSYVPNSYYQNVDIPKDVRKRVNDGLFEVKLGLPIPRTVNGFPLNVEEQELMKNEYGKEVYKRLDNLFSSSYYNSLPLPTKERMVKRELSRVKDIVISQHFRYIPEFKHLWQMYQYAYGWDKKKAKEQAEKEVRKLARQLKGTVE